MKYKIYDKYINETHRLQCKSRYDLIIDALSLKQYSKLMDVSRDSRKYTGTLNNLHKVTKDKKLLSQVPQLIADFEYIQSLYKDFEKAVNEPTVKLVASNDFAIKTYRGNLRIVS